MKSLAVTTVVIGALLAADGAMARDDDRKGDRKDRVEQRHYDGHYDRYSYRDKHHRGYHSKHERRHHERRHFNKHDVVRLDIPVRIRGDERVHLRRLLKNYYNINPDHYRLRKVVVDSRGRHDYASARLKVGGEVSDRTRLERGKNHLRAPRYSNGRWVLGLRNARVNNIRVVLEPRQRYARHEHPRRWMKYRAWY